MSQAESISVQEFVAHQPRYTPMRILLRLFANIVSRILLRMDVRGIENIPKVGGGVIMMNHVGYIDPLLCAAECHHRFIIPMSKAENKSNFIADLIIRLWGSYYVNRGEIDRKALMNSVELMKSGQLILMAPEGTRQPQGLVTPKDGLAYVATKANAIVIPTAVTGTTDFLSYTRRLRRAPVTVSYGKPFRFKTDGRKRIPRDELSQMMNEAMYQLAKVIPDEYVNLRNEYADLSESTTETIEFIDLASPEFN